MFLLLNKNREDHALNDIEGYIFDDSKRELDDKNIEYCMAKRMSLIDNSHAEILETLDKWYKDNADKVIECKDIQELSDEFDTNFSLVNHEDDSEMLLCVCLTPEEVGLLQGWEHLCVGFEFADSYYRYDINLQGLIFSDDTARSVRFKQSYRAIQNREFPIKDVTKLVTIPLTLLVNETNTMQYPPYQVMRVSRCSLV